ncbi:MoaD/ThiS family protein [Halioxenophilus sp. WMMB6]|uniref:MoaD/ThiS family protein n=1 Tax=Halioxenophilus sp. WMMB6 TaxID=3073815 RepID=UPI00295F520D|nr:MoaD/ThiS family protein [Halioxenophilus sp. WMMB6]
MPTVALTTHLYRFFPQLQAQTISVPAGSVAEVIGAIDRFAPGFADYLLDDNGSLRRHVFISVDKRVVVDRKRLSDQVPEQGIVHIFQALTGG